MGKPHICFVSESRATYGLLTGEACDVVGGAELQQTLIASALRELGYSITFLVGDFGQDPKVVTQQGITLIKTRVPARGIRGPHLLDEMLRLRRAMSAADADIYYQRMSAGITGIVALFCKCRRKPFVFSVAHNMDLDGSFAASMGRPRGMLYRYGLKHAAAVVVQTDDQRRLLKENFGREGVLIRSTFSDPDEGERRPTGRHVLWVGNLRPVKRPHIFLEVASRLPRYKFLMVGGPAVGYQELHDEIEAEVRNIPNLRLTGAIPYDQVGRCFGEAFVFVNTSASEGFPNTYLQSWCRGVPVVGTFDPDGVISEHGLGRQCSNVDELVEAVAEFMEDEALRAATGERAAQYVREHHSPEAVAAEYDRLFTRLCPVMM